MPHSGLQLLERQFLSTSTFSDEYKEMNFTFKHELFETGLCYKELILRAANWENWASANCKWSWDFKKLHVTAEVVLMMPALSLMYPESLSSSVDEMARNQYGVLPAF